MPRFATMSTAGTEFDPAKHTDLKLRILKGYAPQGAIIGQYKIYDTVVQQRRFSRRFPAPRGAIYLCYRIVIACVFRSSPNSVSLA